MSMNVIGTVKTAGVYDVNGKDGTKKPMISFVVCDGLGNAFPCQMWNDDPHFAEVSAVIEGYRRHQVQLTIVSYTVRMREFKKTSEIKPWANFVVSDVVKPADASLLSASFTGTVKAGGVHRSAGKKSLLWFLAVDELGTGFPCQMWEDDSDFEKVAALIDADVRRQRVEFLVSSFTLRERTFPDGHTAPQINFVVSDVVFTALAR